MDRRTFLTRLQWLGYPLLVGPLSSLALATPAQEADSPTSVEDPLPDGEPLRITIIGTGGLGGRMVADIAESKLLTPADGILIDYIAVDTDRRSLDSLVAPNLQKAWLQGLQGASGACIEPGVARKLMERHVASLFGHGTRPGDPAALPFSGIAMTIVLAGMGRGAGTGLGQVICRHARDAGSFTAAFLITPFSWETGSSDLSAELALFSTDAHSVMTIPHDESNGDALLTHVLKDAEHELQRRVRLLVNSIASDSYLVALDLEDLRTAFAKGGMTDAVSSRAIIADHETPYAEIVHRVTRQLSDPMSIRDAVVVFSISTSFKFRYLQECMRTLRLAFPNAEQMVSIATMDRTLPLDHFGVDIWVPRGHTFVPRAS